MGARRERGMVHWCCAKSAQTGGLEVGAICRGPLNRRYGPWLLLLDCKAGWVHGG